MMPSSGPHPGAVDLFTRVRRDARSDPKPTELATPFVISMGFDGITTLPTVGMTRIIELGQVKARITGATIVANGIGSAVISLRLGTLADVPLLGPIGTAAPPALVSAATVVIDTSTWQANLQPADVLLATLTSVSGAFTCVALTLHCRRIKWPSGGSTLTDAAHDILTTTGGNTVSIRQ